MSVPAVSGPIDLGVLATLTAASAGGNTADQLNEQGKGIVVISALTGTTPTLTVTIQGKYPVSGTYYTLLASAALNATGFTRLTVYPGLPATANVSANDLLCDTWRVLWAIGGTTPTVTATIAAQIQS